jgi:hypothetical protein
MAAEAIDGKEVNSGLSGELNSSYQEHRSEYWKKRTEVEELQVHGAMAARETPPCPSTRSSLAGLPPKKAKA